MINNFSGSERADAFPAECVEERACAKINLSLDLNGRRGDGYHEIITIMQTVSLFDEVTVERPSGVQDNDAVTMSGNEYGEENLCVRAARMMIGEFGAKGPFHIDLVKNIPAQAGLGGGSADAAAVIRAIRRLCGLSIPDEDLRAASASLGADVPFCISGGTMLAEGIGEILTPLPEFPAFPVVIVKPAFPISTAEAFREYDRKAPDEISHPPKGVLLSALRASDYESFFAYTSNVLEQVVSVKHQRINEIEEQLMKGGAAFAMMSGSGPTVYGLFYDMDRAVECAAVLKKQPGLEKVSLCSIAKGYDNGKS